MTIWLNEQKDGCGIIQACIATTNEKAAQDCHSNWLEKLTPQQKKQGWQVTIKIVANWDDVPVNALKLS